MLVQMSTSLPPLDPGRLDSASRLSVAASSWGIWKNTESALSGRGDIDSVGSSKLRGKDTIL